MRQMTFAAVGARFERYAKSTRRAVFLTEMDKIVPLVELCALIEPYYPKPGNGRPPIPLERMLRIHFLQHWFNLSDPAAEEALYESSTMRAFAGVDLGREPAPDETTSAASATCWKRTISARAFEAAHRDLEEKGLKVSTGTIVDATDHPCAVLDQERREGARSADAPDQEGQSVVFRHEGASGRRQPIEAHPRHRATPANVHDAKVLGDLLHGEETRVWGDQAYRGKTHVIREHAPRAQDFTNRRHRHNGVVDEAARTRNSTKSRVRAKVEHPIGV